MENADSGARSRRTRVELAAVRARQGDIQAAPPLITGLDITHTHPLFLAEWPLRDMASALVRAGERDNRGA